MYARETRWRTTAHYTYVCKKNVLATTSCANMLPTIVLRPIDPKRHRHGSVNVQQCCIIGEVTPTACTCASKPTFETDAECKKRVCQNSVLVKPELWKRCGVLDKCMHEEREAEQETCTHAVNHRPQAYRSNPSPPWLRKCSANLIVIGDVTPTVWNCASKPSFEHDAVC